MEPVTLLNALREVVTRCSAGKERVAVAYSGGLDSSLVAKLASESTEVVCYSCVAAGSHDALRVGEYGRADGFEVIALELTEHDLPSLVARTADGIRSTNPLRIAYTLPMVVVLERCEEDAVFAGNGADELFAGYEKYTRRPAECESEMNDDLRKSMEEADKLEALAEALGKKIILPYLQDEIIDLSREIPLEQKIAGDTRKTILREAGRLAGLSAADRPKKAAQYSSGTLKMMRALSIKDEATLSEWIESVVSTHPLGKN